jgi:hypothetical protein
MSTAPAAIAALAVLSAAGALPALTLAGPRWPTAPLAPLAGSVLAALAAMGCLALGGALLPWFGALAVVAASASLLAWWRWPACRPRAGRVGVGIPPPSWLGRVTGWMGVAAVAVATVWSLRPLRLPAFGFDTRAIYLLHAGWFADGHQVALDALRNPALVFSQQTYPPLSSAAVAVSWLVTGGRSDRLGVVVVALLNAAAVACAALVVVDVGRQAAARVAARTGVGLAVLPALAGVTGGPLLVVAAFGIAGPYATDGYTDLLWAAAAVAGMGWALALSGRGRELGAAAVVLAVAGLTKDEGAVTAAVIVVLVAGRTAVAARAAHPGRWPWRPVVAGLAGVAALGLWPALARVLGATVVPSGPEPGDLGSRLHQTVSGLAPHLHPVAVALVVSVVGALLALRYRRAIGLGTDLLGWAVLTVYLVLLGHTYVTTTGTVGFRLLTSVDRTTVFPGVAGWFLVAVWAVVGLSGPGLARRSAPEARAPEVAQPEPAGLGPAE